VSASTEPTKQLGSVFTGPFAAYSQFMAQRLEAVQAQYARDRENWPKMTPLERKAAKARIDADLDLMHEQVCEFSRSRGVLDRYLVPLQKEYATTDNMFRHIVIRIKHLARMLDELNLLFFGNPPTADVLSETWDAIVAEHDKMCPMQQRRTPTPEEIRAHARPASERPKREPPAPVVPVEPEPPAEPKPEPKPKPPADPLQTFDDDAFLEDGEANADR
jgi:hypothetical protein